MINSSTNYVNKTRNGTQFFKLTVDRVKQDYIDGLITAEGYILYLLDIHSFGEVGWSIDATDATAKWGIPKRTYYRAIEKLKSSGRIKISTKTARVHRVKSASATDVTRNAIGDNFSATNGTISATNGTQKPENSVPVVVSEIPQMISDNKQIINQEKEINNINTLSVNKYIKPDLDLAHARENELKLTTTNQKESKQEQECLSVISVKELSSIVKSKYPDLLPCIPIGFRRKALRRQKQGLTCLYVLDLLEQEAEAVTKLSKRDVDAEIEKFIQEFDYAIVGTFWFRGKELVQDVLCG